MTHEELIALALQSGADKAAIIRGEDVVLSASFRDICRINGCGLYGRCWMCPPDIGEIGELMARVRAFDHALLYQTIHGIEDSFDIEGMTGAGAKHALVSQRINDAVKLLPEERLHLSCGGCHLCPRCAKMDGKPCRMPGKALPPMEGYGIDVYQTTRPTELKYINGQNTVTYFGIVLF